MSAENPIKRDFTDRQVEMFGMFVGDHGRIITRAALARATGLDPSSLKDWANGVTMPAHALLRLAQFLPAEAINMLTAPAGKRLVDIEHAETNWDAIACTAATLVSDVCEARRDGKIDHVESAKLKQRTRALIAEAQSAVEAG